MFAVVDIETTGGSPIRDRITEVAIYLHDGVKIIDEFTSLINPEVYIPPYITRLTGISNEMVASAPCFFEVAKNIVELTEGAHFVAHNVQFDYRFIQSEFKRLGYNYIRNTLCTVKQSRKFFPGYSSYSLGVICQHLKIPINGRHRAAGDALATVKLLEKILLQNPDLINGGLPLTKFEQRGLHPNLSWEKINKLPEAVGVYYLYNQSGGLLYIGKSNNIRKRILQHLSGEHTKRAIEMRSQVTDIDYEITGSELVALIVEAEQIKTNLPTYNKRSRRKSSQFCYVAKFDGEGYLNISIETTDNAQQPIACFQSMEEARNLLYKMVDEYNLCQKLCGLYQSHNACFQYQIGQCKGACVGQELSPAYNLRVNRAIDSLSLGNRSYLLVDSGRTPDEKSFVKVVNGKLEGYGFFNPEYVGNNMELLSESIHPCGNYKEAIFAVKSFLAKAKQGQVISLSLPGNTRD
jgi:DNA polymerase-3 subunit epsilon